ncbi:MAG: nucleotidyltransferase domain-containing protein [Nitrosopumilus sp.]|nr:nucleotidyltransferase domain-containing protein [Nitrosopumilus sp.]
MRLKPEEVKIIKDAVAVLDPQAKVFLFGSRVDPEKKGGDIDLLILSQVLTDIDSLKIHKILFEEMEEQKIDILIAADSQDPFVKLALTKSIKL